MSEPEGLGIEGGKQRSPAYPYISLDLAIERAKKIYAQAKDHPQTREVMARVYGKPVTSSATLQTFATLVQYGLLETIAVGSQKRLQVTTPLKIISNSSTPAKQVIQAKQFCALRPRIFKELFDKFEYADVHDSLILFYLTSERESSHGTVYTDKAAQEVLRVYRATLAYAGLGPPDKSEPVELDGNDDEPQKEEASPSPDIPASNVARPARTERTVVLTDGERVLQTGMLSPTSEYRVLVTGKVGVKEIEWLIKKLQMDKEILGSKPEARLED